MTRISFLVTRTHALGWLPLEVQPKRQLPRPIPAILRRLHALYDAERRRSHIRRRWREVRMIQQISERTLKSQPQALAQMKCLRQTGSNGSRTRSFQTTDRAIPHRPGGNRIERINIKHAAGSRVGDVS